MNDIIAETEKMRILPRCPEPLGLKLGGQLYFLRKAKTDTERMQIVRAIQKTLDDIDQYGLYKPPTAVKDKYEPGVKNLKNQPW